MNIIWTKEVVEHAIPLKGGPFIRPHRMYELNELEILLKATQMLSLIYHHLSL